MGKAGKWEGEKPAVYLSAPCMLSLVLLIPTVVSLYLKKKL